MVKKLKKLKKSYKKKEFEKYKLEKYQEFLDNIPSEELSSITLDLDDNIYNTIAERALELGTTPGNFLSFLLKETVIEEKKRELKKEHDGEVIDSLEFSYKIKKWLKLINKDSDFYMQKPVMILEYFSMKNTAVLLPAEATNIIKKIEEAKEC